jgi:hypothetical protein
MQLKVQIIEFNPLRRRQARKQTLRHTVQIRRQRADVDQLFGKSIGGEIEIASDEFVFDDERLIGPEVARVVEADGGFGGDGGALHKPLSSASSSGSLAPQEKGGICITFEICHCILSLTIHLSQRGLQYRSATGCLLSSNTVA